MPLTCENVVGDTGLEPVTSSVSGKRASQTAPIARAVLLCVASCLLHQTLRATSSSCEVETGFEPV